MLHPEVGDEFAHRSIAREPMVIEPLQRRSTRIEAAGEPADAFVGFQDRDAHPGSRQLPGSRETRESCSYDYDLRAHARCRFQATRVVPVEAQCMRSLRTCSAILAALLGCSCAQIQRPKPGVAPPGVVIPHTATAGENYRGLYLTADADRGIWLAPHATITLRVTHPSSRLVLVTYLPNQGQYATWYARHPIALRITIPGKAPQSHCCLTGGLQSTHYDLPKRKGPAGTITFDLQSLGVTTPPGQSSLRDRRQLALVLARLFTY